MSLWISEYRRYLVGKKHQQALRSNRKSVLSYYTLQALLARGHDPKGQVAFRTLLAESRLGLRLLQQPEQPE